MIRVEAEQPRKRVSIPDKENSFILSQTIQTNSPVHSASNQTSTEDAIHYSKGFFPRAKAAGT